MPRDGEPGMHPNHRLHERTLDTSLRALHSKEAEFFFHWSHIHGAAKMDTRYLGSVCFACVCFFLGGCSVLFVSPLSPLLTRTIGESSSRQERAILEQLQDPESGVVSVVFASRNGRHRRRVPFPIWKRII